MTKLKHWWAKLWLWFHRAEPAPDEVPALHEEPVFEFKAYPTYVNHGKDRTLPGKRRRVARKVKQRAS